MASGLSQQELDPGTGSATLPAVPPRWWRSVSCARQALGEPSPSFCSPTQGPIREFGNEEARLRVSCVPDWHSRSWLWSAVPGPWEPPARAHRSAQGLSTPAGAWVGSAGARGRQGTVTLCPLLPCPLRSRSLLGDGNPRVWLSASPFHQPQGRDRAHAGLGRVLQPAGAQGLE